MRRLHGVLGLTIAASLAAGAAQIPRITRIEFSPAPEAEGGGMLITLVGNGVCTYTLDYGDEKTERRTATLPDKVSHRYAADGDYLVTATPEPPCEGVARAKLAIRPVEKGIWKVTVVPGTDPHALEVVATIDGRGACAVTVDFGDGTVQKLDGELPSTINHTYEKAGSYELRATAASPCRGDVRTKLDVR
jgi:PKD domain